AGGAAGDTITTYYTSSTSGTCVSAVQAGLACSTGPAAQPTSGNPLPVTVTTYNSYDQPVTVTETAGATVRTSTTTYDAAGRATSSSLTVTSAADGGTALPDVSTSYNTTTGLPTTVTAGGKTLTTDYDSLGRAVRYTDATGNTATTTYDLSGRVATVNDGKATTSYTYDSATEHRGLVTAEDIGAGAAPGTFTADYDAAGNLTTQTYPNGLTATTSYDNAGNDTSLIYTQAGVAWYGFTQTPGSDGNTAAQTSPQSSQQFGYDNGRRLITVKDTVPDPVSGLSCTTRSYSLSKNSNRTVLNNYPDDGSNPDAGNCTTTTTPIIWTGSYDQADRLTNTDYAYDNLGRTLSVPAADAIGLGSHATTTGNLTLGYYANDFAATQSQGGRTVGFSLDPLQNRVLDTSDTAGTTSTNHYIDNGDSPAWTSTPTGWTRNITGITGGLAATIDQTGAVTLHLTNPHGDIIATSPDDPAATGPNSYSESTEFGAPRNPTTTPDTYGWLGAKQRSTNDLAGLTLMGVRLYNPTTARFLTTDPIPGGTDNPYVYVLNPTDDYDLNGQWRCRWCERHSRLIHAAVSIAVTVGVGLAVAGICGATAGVGCLVIGGALMGSAASLGGHWAASRYLTRQRVTNRQAVRWVAQGAGSGAFGAFRASTGASNLAFARSAGRIGSRRAWQGVRAAAAFRFSRFF
ncbi:MAG: RHS repeat-associated core domain-containing protein, partial [Jatrophihabitantaceae bacterium]